MAMLRRTVLVLVVAAASATGSLTFTAGASAYGAGYFCDSVLIDTGNTCLAANPRNIERTRGGSVTEAGGAGSALACVGGKTYQSASAPWLPNYVCATYGGQWVDGAYSASGFGCCTWPAIHNHSTFLSRFRGYVEFID
jgi:hypothetical protein